MTRPLNLGGAARYKSESQRPDLWPDIFASPVVGQQGSLLLDLSGNKNTGIHYTGATAGTQGIYEFAVGRLMLNCTAADRNIRFPFAMTDWPVTLFISGVTNAANSCTITIGDSGTNTQAFGVGINSSQVRGFIYSGLFNGFSGGSVTSGQYFTAALIVESNTVRRIYQNGVLVATDATDSDVIASGIDSLYIGALVRSSVAYYSGYYSTCAAYKRVLSDSQLLELSQDPLNAIRRKTMISLYVPSGAQPATSIPVIMNHYRRLRTA